MSIINKIDIIRKMSNILREKRKDAITQARQALEPLKDIGWFVMADYRDLYISVHSNTFRGCMKITINNNLQFVISTQHVIETANSIEKLENIVADLIVRYF